MRRRRLWRTGALVLAFAIVLSEFVVAPDCDAPAVVTWTFALGLPALLAASVAFALRTRYPAAALLIGIAAGVLSFSLFASSAFARCTT